jgi:hypothetical protein
VERIAANRDDGVLRKFLSFGIRFSRNCFLCLGGAFLLIAIVSLAVNVPDMIRFGDWTASEVKEALVVAAVYAVAGAILSTAAYGLSKSTRWAGRFAAVVSTLALALMTVAVATEPVERADLAAALSFFAVPLSFTWIWAVAAAIEQLQERKLSSGTRGQREHFACAN